MFAGRRVVSTLLVMRFTYLVRSLYQMMLVTVAPVLGD